MDLTDRIEHEDKSITVLDEPDDVRSVLTRYAGKGWECVHTSRCRTYDKAIVLHLQRPIGLRRA